MRRHRSLVLLVPAVMLSAACSGRDDASTQNPLDRDLTLSAQLTRGQQDSSALAELASGGACKTEPTPAAPTAAQRAQAAVLEQRAGEAEFVGNIQAARDLHRQAARLDGRSEEIAYRLARADESLGDRAAAVKGYCRYLSLAPTAANAKEVRTRLMALATPAAPTQVAAQPTQQAAQQRTPTPVRVRSTTQARRRESYVSTGAPAATTTAPATPAAGVTAAPSATDSAAGVPAGGGPVYGSAAGEVVEAQSTSAPSTPTVRRGTDHTLRNAAIGAAAGAAIGAVIDRSAKGAVIGGVAGGVLGAVVGRTTSRTSGFRTPGWAR